MCLVIVRCVRGSGEGEGRDLNHLQLNTSKTKEMLLDFRRHHTSPLPVNISDEEVEVVTTFKYLVLQLDNKLDCALFYRVVCLGGRDTQRPDKVIKKAGSLVQNRTALHHGPQQL